MDEKYSGVTFQNLYYLYSDIYLDNTPINSLHGAHIVFAPNPIFLGDSPVSDIFKFAPVDCRLLFRTYFSAELTRKRLAPRCRTDMTATKRASASNRKQGKKTDRSSQQQQFKSAADLPVSPIPVPVRSISVVGAGPAISSDNSPRLPNTTVSLREGPP